MTNKNTKRELFLSILSMIVCVSMLIGSTFAWFTDTVSTGVNKIVAGNLEIGLQYATAWDSGGNPTAWDNAEGKTLDFIKANNADEEILWEPGATFSLPTVKLVNNGNLAIKFNMVINGIYGDLELADVLEVIINDKETDLTLAEFMADPDGAAHGVILPVGSEETTLAKDTTIGESAEYTIALHMQEEAGNKYQGMSLGGMTFTAFASQYTYENDMTDNTYDKDAATVQEQNVLDLVSDGYTKVTTYDELKTAITNGENVVLASDIVANTNELLVATGKTIVLDLNGYTISVTDSEVNGYESIIHVKQDASLTINDSAVIGAIVYDYQGPQENYRGNATIWCEGTLVLNGGKLEMNPNGASLICYAVDLRPNVWGEATPSTPASFTMNGGSLVAYSDEAVRVQMNSASGNGDDQAVTFTMNGGTVSGYSAAFVQQNDNNLNKLVVNINGGTIDTTKYVFRTYGVFNTTTYAGSLSGIVNYITVSDNVDIVGTTNYSIAMSDITSVTYNQN